MGYRVKNNRLEKLSANGIARQRRKIGMVFQQFNLYPHMTVLQNIIEAPVGVHGESRKSATENAMRLLERVGLSEKPPLIRVSSPVDNNSVSQSRVPWPSSRNSCCSMSRHPHSIPNCR